MIGALGDLLDLCRGYVPRVTALRCAFVPCGLQISTLTGVVVLFQVPSGTPPVNACELAVRLHEAYRRQGYNACFHPEQPRALGHASQDWDEPPTRERPLELGCPFGEPSEPR